MAGRHENFSVFVTKTLNAVGYKWETIQQRRDFAKELERSINNSVQLANSGLTTIIAGSQREGVTKPYGGDSDTMLVINEVVATETPELFDDQSKLTVLHLDMIGCPPGYSSLTPVKHGGRWFSNHMTEEMASYSLQNVIGGSCCVSDHGQVYVSSEQFFDILFKQTQFGINTLGNETFPDSILSGLIHFHSRAGPSLSTSSGNNFFIQTSQDTVVSIPCQCPSIFETFRTRQRKHGWPQEYILQELSQLDAHVVPVGHKGSPHNFQEWRICFTKAEIRLIECLTEPQIHVFVLLKLFAKYYLKEVWDIMTSYVMKNIILWIAEFIPSQRFRTDTIVDRFLDCLFFLKICIKGGRLPNFMISERNLLCHGTFIVKKRKLLSALDDCLQEKGSCLLRIPTLKEYMLKMYSEPAVLTKNGLKRDQMEHAVISFVTQFAPKCNLATSVQDIQQVVLSGAASDLIQLFMQRFSLDEIESDPIAVLQRCFADLI